MTTRKPSRYDFGPLAEDYDRWYQTPDGQMHDRAQKQDVRDLLSPAGAGQSLLDVGCGTGHWSAFFAEMGYRVTGIDVAREMIQRARIAVPDGTFRVADACELPFDDGSFDVVASMATIEFVTEPVAAIREMVRCARSGGVLLIGTLNPLAPLNRQRLLAGEPPYASARMFSPGELRRLLRPWGRVGMRASSPAQHGPRRARARRLAALGRGPDGPFIVAEVRR